VFDSLSEGFFECKINLDISYTNDYNNSMNSSQKHPIRVVSRQTGLSPHVIRVWERRYGAISPVRTASNRRLYSDQNIVRLILLYRATRAGYSIGQIANLPDDDLRNLVLDNGRDLDRSPDNETRSGPVTARAHLDNCIGAVGDLDQESLENSLSLATIGLSQPVLIEQVLVPLMIHIGESWRYGSLRVAHEHLASAIVRSFLGNMSGAFDIPESAPELIVSTPSGQLHEIGALIAAATAQSLGWQVTYLGPNLPAEEIASAARQRNARAVALSIVYPPDEPRMGEELKKIRRLLPDDITIIIGGRAADAYPDPLSEIGANIMDDISSFRVHLEHLRTS
jgi:DNA-binding transcriptional MerR regulator/methylmalonyl-CoA mutase cobalamin-binding subunit